jgi:hypothetical protein
MCLVGRVSEAGQIAAWGGLTLWFETLSGFAAYEKSRMPPFWAWEGVLAARGRYHNTTIVAEAGYFCSLTFRVYRREFKLLSRYSVLLSKHCYEF